MAVDESIVGHPFFSQISCAQLARDASGVVIMRFHTGVRMDAKNTAELAQAHLAATMGAPFPLLADIRGVRSADRDARQLGREPENSRLILRMALLVQSPLTRVLANFFARATRPGYPILVFSDESLARQWLLKKGDA